MRRATRTPDAIPHRKLFQSTLSMRRATQIQSAGQAAVEFQSTLSMRRATLAPRPTLALHAISIHALHEESDSLPIAAFSTFALFQSTLSMRRATGSILPSGGDDRISIHALHEESDSNQQTMQLADIFQSTLSMRRATTRKRRRPSIPCYFNPRSP